MWIVNATRRARMLAAALAMGTASCSVTPAYHRHDADVPTSWSAAATDVAGVNASWWRGFGSPELDSLVARSSERNLDLRAAIARIDEARGQAEVAGAPRYPSLGVAASASQGVGPSGTRVQTIGVVASYEFDFWGRYAAQASSAGALADASVFDAQTVWLTLQASVAETYLEILTLRARLALAKHVVEAARQTLVLVGARAAGGVASQVEVEQQRNAVATFEATVPALEQQLDQRFHRLAALTGDAPARFRTTGGDLLVLTVPRAAAGLPSSLLDRRPDIRAAEERLISANFDVAAARAAFYPSFTLTAQAGVGNTSLASFFPPVLLANMVAGMTQPLFAGGRLEGQLRYDRAHATELLATYRQAILNSLRDVEDALAATMRTGELEIADEAAADAARRASMLARAQLEAGTADFLTVLTTERAEYQAGDALLQVRLQRLRAAVGLFRALGGGFGTQGRAS